jgi:ABC-type thiamine transport system substrate-binding protein
MNKNVIRLFNEILSLNQSERSALLLALFDWYDEELTSDDALEAWKQIAQDRLDSLDRGDSSAVPWAEAKARLLAL